MYQRTEAYRKLFTPLLVGLMFLIHSVSVQGNMLGQQVPQVPAFLPLMTEVPMAEKQPIDGEWIISSNRKRIRIEGGRAYVLDPWVHLFVLKVEPMMVVIKDLQRTATGQYTGEDLPLMGRLTATLNSNGHLKVTVDGTLGPAKYDLIPVRLDDPEGFEREKSGQDSLPSTGDNAKPGLENCKNLQFDNTLGQVMCKDSVPGADSNEDLVKCQNLKFDKSLGRVICADPKPDQKTEQNLASCENLKYDQELEQVVCMDETSGPGSNLNMENCEQLEYDQASGQIICLD